MNKGKLIVDLQEQEIEHNENGIYTMPVQGFKREKRDRKSVESLETQIYHEILL